MVLIAISFNVASVKSPFGTGTTDRRAGVPRHELWKSCLSADAFLFLSGDVANPLSLYTLQFKEYFPWLGSAYAVKWDVRKLNCSVPAWVIFVVPGPTVWGSPRFWGSCRRENLVCCSCLRLWLPEHLWLVRSRAASKVSPKLLPSAPSSQVRLGNSSSKCCWFFGVES